MHSWLLPAKEVSHEELRNTSLSFHEFLRLLFRSLPSWWKPDVLWSLDLQDPQAKFRVCLLCL